MFWRYRRLFYEKSTYILAAVIGIVLTGAIIQNKGIVETLLVLIGILGMIRLNVPRRRKNKFKHSGIEEIDKMDGHTFEKYLKSLFMTLGYKAIVTQSSGDFGADLILEKNNMRIVVQAKRYSNNVGISAVQEAHAAIPFYKAHQAWVVTNAGFTKSARQLASSTNVRLIGRSELIELLLQAKNQSALSRKA